MYALLDARAVLRSYHFLFDKRFQRVDLAVVLSLDELDFSEGTLADDLQR
jgi:hypothetical protein